jgi:hypothetical protein
VVALHGVRHLLGVAGLVVGRQIEADGEGVDRTGNDLAGQGRYCARIDASRQEDAQRHVGDELHPDGVHELVAQFGHRRLAVRRGRHVPVLAHLARVLLPAAVLRLDGQDAGGGQEMDALDDGIGAHHEALPQIRCHGRGLEAARHPAAGKKSTHLGGEEQHLLAGVAIANGGPVQRLDAHRVAHEMDGAGARVPQGQREDAAKTPHGVDAPALIGLEDDLGVAR